MSSPELVRVVPPSVVCDKVPPGNLPPMRVRRDGDCPWCGRPIADHPEVAVKHG